MLRVAKLSCGIMGWKHLLMIVLILTQQLFYEILCQLSNYQITNVSKIYRGWGENTVEILIQTYFQWIVMLDALLTLRRCQSHYIEVAQGDIFMEQKMWFGLVLGWMSIGNTEKNKFGPIMSNFWGRFFHVFGCKKKWKNFFWKIL